MPLDQIKFIECIKANPSIWARRTKASSLPDKKTGWNKVAENIVPNWFEITAEEKEKNMQKLKDRWKNLKNRFLKDDEMNNVNGKKKHYRFRKHLQFLDVKDKKMPLDQIKFIECIKANPSIWARRTKASSLPDKKTGWNKVAENIVPNWFEITAEEKEKNMQKLKDRWKNLKNRFLKDDEMNNVNGKKKHYRFRKHLQFLDVKDEEEKYVNIEKTTENCNWNTVKFIQCIEANPSIWDNKSPSDSLQEQQATSWNNVAANMLPNWFEMTAEEMEENKQTIKLKWRNLKRRYMKTRDIGMTGDNSNKKQYRYKKYFQFLEKAEPRLKSTLPVIWKTAEEIEQQIKQQEGQKIEKNPLETTDVNAEAKEMKKHKEQQAEKIPLETSDEDSDDEPLQSRSLQVESPHYQQIKQQEGQTIEKNPLETTDVNAEVKEMKQHKAQQAEKIPLKTSDEDSDDEPLQSIVDRLLQHVESPPLPEPPQKEIRTSSQRPIKRKIITRFQNQHSLILKRKREDPDKDFLLSILPDYEMLSSDKKRDFQLFAFKYLKWAELQN